VKREFQARFRENVRVKFPRVTRLATSLQNRDTMRILTLLTIGLIVSMNFLSEIKASSNLSFNRNVSNDTLKNVAEEIINGRKIETIELSMIYQIIDSVSTINPSDREFYFKVFNEIDRQAKGELAVEMDWKIKDFCYKYPNDFFSISETKIIDYAQRIGELLRTEEEFPKKAANEYIEHVRNNADKRFEKQMTKFSLELMKKVK